MFAGIKVDIVGDPSGSSSPARRADAGAAQRNRYTSDRAACPGSQVRRAPHAPGPRRGRRWSEGRSQTAPDPCRRARRTERGRPWSARRRARSGDPPGDQGDCACWRAFVPPGHVRKLFQHTEFGEFVDRLEHIAANRMPRMPPRRAYLGGGECGEPVDQGPGSRRPRSRSTPARRAPGARVGDHGQGWVIHRFHRPRAERTAWCNPPVSQRDVQRRWRTG